MTDARAFTRKWRDGEEGEKIGQPEAGGWRSEGWAHCFASSSRPVVLLDDFEPRKKQWTDVSAGGERDETNLGKNVIDLEDQREGIRAEGPQPNEQLMEEELRAPWTLAFETFSRHQINYGDCASLSSSVAYGILRAGSLLRDVNEAPKEPALLIGEIAQYLVLVSASPCCSLLLYCSG